MKLQECDDHRILELNEISVVIYHHPSLIISKGKKEKERKLNYRERETVLERGRESPCLSQSTKLPKVQFHICKNDYGL